VCFITTATDDGEGDGGDEGRPISIIAFKCPNSWTMSAAAYCADETVVLGRDLFCLLPLLLSTSCLETSDSG
jgi:hypothetical protein